MEYVFISGWTRSSEPGGISQFSFDPETGCMEFMGSIETETAFGTVFVNREKDVLYAVNEIRDLKGGNVYSYSVNRETGEMKLLGTVSTLLPNPAYIGQDASGKYAVVADHSCTSQCAKIEKNENGQFHPVILNNDAGIVLYRIDNNGELGEILDVVKHEGRGPGKRQDMPHPHCVVFSPDGEMFAVCDKGTDHVHIYTIDREKECLREICKWKEANGSMPRYAAFHPEKNYFYHNNENCNRIDAFEYDEKGTFKKKGEFFTVPEPFDGEAEQQGLCMHPTGKFLYSALKKPEGISAFKVKDDGSLELIQIVSKNYSWLRGIEVHPSGKYLIATYMEEGKVVLFKILENGALLETGKEFDVPRAAGIAFF